MARLDSYFFCRYDVRMKKKRLGRPKKAVAERKSRYLQVRVDDAEKAAFDRAASTKGLDTSSWVRLRLREAAKKDLSDVPFTA